MCEGTGRIAASAKIQQEHSTLAFDADLPSFLASFTNKKTVHQMLNPMHRFARQNQTAEISMSFVAVEVRLLATFLAGIFL